MVKVSKDDWYGDYVELDTCDICGAYVNDISKHRTWHDILNVDYKNS